MQAVPSFIQRYAAWLDRRRHLVLALSLFITALAGVIAAKLPLQSSFTNLLPPSEQSVRDLKVLEKRARSFGTVFVLIESKDPALREAAAEALHERVRAMNSDLIGLIYYDDRVARQYFWENRFLFMDMADLKEAQAALKDAIRDAKLDANPLFIDLDDDAAEGESESAKARLAKLRERMEEAETKAKASGRFISKDGTLQFFTIQTTFATSSASKAKRLLGYIDQAIADVKAQFGPNVGFAITGTVPSALYEHNSILRGTITAAVITILVVTIALVWYYRAFLPVMVSLWSLIVGALATFAITYVAIGHLNLMTAFLGAIVVGNGINTGLILLARYFEELRAGEGDVDAIARAIAGAAPGTLAAALTAGVAYGSLIVTDFRGFRHFGFIAGLGMVLCWITAFSVLPAGLCVLRKRGWLRVGKPPAIGELLGRLLPKHLTSVIWVAVLITAVSGVITWRYIAGNPLLVDWRELRSESEELRQAQAWDQRMKESFDRGVTANAASEFVIAVDSDESARALTRTLHALEEGKPEGEQLLSRVRSLDDLLPKDQEEKLALLGEIRAMLADPAVAEAIGDPELLKKITPPEDLKALTYASVPEAVALPFIEQDGTRGHLILARSASRFTTWNINDRVAFAEGVRKINLPDDAVLGGQSFVIADIIGAMNRDAPIAVLVALLGSVIAIWLMVGVGRHSFVTLICLGMGILTMIAICALLGVKVHFLDLIALPITIGVGADYAVNLAARERQEPGIEPRALLATTGSAVLLCSFTTMVGYGTLLLSENGGIRSFGLAAIVGEITCVIAALLVCPAVLALLRGRRAA